MKLSTKLLLGVGILLLAMAIVMYILPTWLIRRDVYTAANEIHDLLVADHEQLIKSQQVWVKDAMETAKANNNALLFMLYQVPQFNSRLIIGKNSDKDLWNALATVAGYDPNIGFVQTHSPSENKAAVINTQVANLYPINKYIPKEGFALFSLLPTHPSGEKLDFIGIPLPQEMQKEPDFTLYALLDLKKTKEQLSEVHEEFAKVTPEYVGKQLYEATQLEAGAEPWKETAYLWAVKVDMIRLLTPLFVEGLALTGKESTIIPEGLARVDKTQNGYAILTHEVYSTQPLFDDASYYKQHQPRNPVSPPLASGSTIVSDSLQNTAFISNTLLLGSSYFSIGSPLDCLARQLALASNRIILFQVEGNLWFGFDRNGIRIPSSKVRQIVRGVDFNQKTGTVAIDADSYLFNEIASLEEGRLIFYDLHSFQGERSIVSTLLHLEDKLSKRIALQLSLISLGTMFLVLLFIGRIGYTIIYPVTKLAKATQDVVAGRYEEVVMPDVGDRKDEVAILTRSFEDMVKGLQEREKIRGVLDKVVSKDVANEILKSQIHLGGEDRIVTMLFSDIRNFTAITNKLTPQKTIHLLNACMTKISRVIEGEGGVIDKYVGDEVMAIFGAPTIHPDHALRAVSSALLIIETLKKWNLTRVPAGAPPIEMGIGVHTGLVVAGNMGAEDRLNYTVLGANVNLAARLCEVAKADQLLISEATLMEPNIQESFYTKPLPPITLKGFTIPVQIYEVTGFKWD